MLRFVPQSDLGMLDPIWTAAFVTRNHGLMVFDTLYGMDEAYRAQPQMVEGHAVAADGLTWTMTLREGLRFHDGAPVLARDASPRSAAGRRGTPSAGADGGHRRARGRGDRTHPFRLKRPFPLLPMRSASPARRPASSCRSAWPRPTVPPVTEMVGSGPFRFLTGERMPGSRTACLRTASKDER